MDTSGISKERGGQRMHNAPQIVFRRAAPQDAAAAVPLILSSGPESFDYVFRTLHSDPAGFLHYAFADGSGQFGYRNHVVGELQGQVVAVGAGWSRARNLTFTLDAARQFLAFFGAFGTVPVILRGLRTESVIRPPGAGDWYLGQLGVDPAYRGQGIGAGLIAHLLAAGAAAGLRHAVLDVSVANPRAEALYARLGFAVTATRRSSLRRAAGFVPDHRRMVRAL